MSQRARAIVSSAVISFSSLRASQFSVGSGGLSLGEAEPRPDHPRGTLQETGDLVQFRNASKDV